MRKGPEAEAGRAMSSRPAWRGGGVGEREGETKEAKEEGRREIEIERDKEREREI